MCTSNKNFNKNKLMNSMQELFLLTTIFTSLRVDSMSYIMPTFGVIQNVVMLIALAFLVLYYLKKRAISKTILLVSLYSLFLLIDGIIHGSGIESTLVMAQLRIISLSLVFGYGMENRPLDCLKAFSLVSSSLVYLNFITVLAFPNGLYATDVYESGNWLLGYKNIAIYIILPAICIRAAYSMIVYKKYTKGLIFLFTISLLTQILTDCKTGIVGLIYLGILLFIIQKNELPKFLNLRNEIILIIVMIVSLVSTSIIDNINEFIILIGEGKSLSSRFEVWARAIEIFFKSPLVGYGIQSPEAYRDIIDLDLGFTKFSHPHNFFLYLLLQGGIIGTCIIAYLFYILGKRCSRYRKVYLARVFIVMYMIFFILGITESMTGATLFLPLLVLANCFFGLKGMRDINND